MIVALLINRETSIRSNDEPPFRPFRRGGRDDPPPNDGRFPCARKEPGAFGFVNRLCGRDEDARGRRASEDAFRLEFVE